MKIAQVFDNAKLYEIFQSVVDRRETQEIIRNEILKPDQITNVLDFGCGIGYHSELFKSAHYLGIEPLEACIAVANRRYASSRVEFELGDHLSMKALPDNSFDLVIAIGVLHHIDNEIFGEFIQEAFRILTPGARFTSFDPVFHSEQSKISEWVVKQDRGGWVRTEADYMGVIGRTFQGVVETKIYSNLLRIPYDHIAIHAFKSVGEE